MNSWDNLKKFKPLLPETDVLLVQITSRFEDFEEKFLHIFSKVSYCILVSV